MNLRASAWRGNCEGMPTMIAGNSVLRRCAEPLLNVARPASAGQRAAADVRAERPQPPQNWTALPVGARCYIAAVTGLGAAALMLALQQISERDAPLLTALAVLSLITAFAKTTLSVPGSASTLSFCYVIDFTALLVLGPAAATLTSALGVWAQGTFRARRRGPRYRTWFSIGALALTVQAAWLTYTRFGGNAGEPIVPSGLLMLAATATVYFFSNTMLVAGAVAFTTRQRTLRVWRSTFASIWPGHLFGFSVAAAASAGLGRSKLCLLPFTVAILALTYDTLHAYVEGLSESLIDPMTDLPNLRYLRTHAARELDRAERDATPLAVLMIDVVRFKAINDTYGHRAGDFALREVAQRLQASVRSYDICARYAGDEFVVVLPGCSAGEAQAKAAALQEAVAGARFELSAGTAVRLDVSVGLAMFPEQGNSFEALLAVADKAMFDSKRGHAGGGIDRGAGSAPRKARLAVNRGLAPAV
jgi:diguanylate cyclase (GGDEF)-like protein